MEYFYRDMRKKTGYLMDGGEPVGGRWNFDSENREPPNAGLAPPAPLKPQMTDHVRAAAALVSERFPGRFGNAADFSFAVTRDDAQNALRDFIENRLPSFGDYQDAMKVGEPFLFHAVIAQYINIGLIDPRSACEGAIAAYHAGVAPINAVEGFVRQIIGWREFVRGIYWLEGDGYVDHNFFDANRPLPEFYWTGKTRMACVSAVVGQTRDQAYAHHIQRLMVTGNFALLAGIAPMAVHEWYLSVYADAYEWVEVPNVIGMALFADGGLLASKPYAASGAYINRMSDYCRGCGYSVSKKTEDDACPFNALYWDFLVRNRDRLKNNGRVSRAYQTWDRMGVEKQSAYRKRAADVLRALDEGKSV